jgi:hypothetical protein
VFLIDEAYIYERDEFKEESLAVFNELVMVVADPDISAAIKLLFTSTRRAGCLREIFQREDEDLILNVETTAHQRGMPSEKRMRRQMIQNLDDGDII